MDGGKGRGGGCLSFLFTNPRKEAQKAGTDRRRTETDNNGAAANQERTKEKEGEREARVWCAALRLHSGCGCSSFLVSLLSFLLVMSSHLCTHACKRPPFPSLLLDRPAPALLQPVQVPQKRLPLPRILLHSALPLLFPHGVLSVVVVGGGLVVDFFILFSSFLIKYTQRHTNTSTIDDAPGRSCRPRGCR